MGLLHLMKGVLLNRLQEFFSLTRTPFTKAWVLLPWFFPYLLDYFLVFVTLISYSLCKIIDFQIFSIKNSAILKQCSRFLYFLGIPSFLVLQRLLFRKLLLCWRLDIPERRRRKLFRLIEFRLIIYLPFQYWIISPQVYIIFKVEHHSYQWSTHFIL